MFSEQFNILGHVLPYAATNSRNCLVVLTIRNTFDTSDLFTISISHQRATIGYRWNVVSWYHLYPTHQQHSLA